MKSFKQLKEEIANMSAGIGVRGYRKGMLKYTKFKSDVPLRFAPLKSKNLQEGLEKDHYKAIDDVHVNLENRNHAIDEYGYGPMNPNEDSTDFWKQKAKLWKNTVEEAKKSRCGNCAAFNQSKEIIKRIADALGPAGEKITEMSGLGYCEMFHFKCAASRTCDAWLVNGPIKEEIGGMAGTVGGTSVGTGYIAGAGAHLEGKPSNWGEPGVQPKYQKKKKKKKKKEDDPRLFAMFKRKTVSMLGTGLKEIPIQEEEITNTTDAAPGLGDNNEVFPGKIKKNKAVWPLFRRLPLNLQEEVKTGMFAGEQTFIVPSHIFEKTVHAKKKGKHWRTYINDEMFHPAIREYANKNLKCPVIIEDEKTGYMCYARYGRKKR